MVPYNEDKVLYRKLMNAWLSGGSSNQTLWDQLVDTVGLSHISYSKILLVSSKPVVAPHV
jgi:hypothetical protein